MSVTTERPDVAAAIRRVEVSRESHARWAEHLRAGCSACEANPPAYIQSLEEHERIVAEYDNVLAVLREVGS